VSQQTGFPRDFLKTLPSRAQVLFLEALYTRTGSETGIVPVTSGGTGLAIYTQGDLIYASAADVITRLGKTATSSYLSNGGTSNNPAWTAKAALTKADDTNVTLSLSGGAATALLTATSITAGWSGQLGVTRGGTGANLSATGGAGQVLKQTSVGGVVTVGTVTAGDISSGAALTAGNDTNVTLTVGGSAASALLAAASVTAGWAGTLSVARGGTGQGTHSPALLDAVLVAPRVPFATTGGRLTSEAGFDYDNSSLAVKGFRPIYRTVTTTASVAVDDYTLLCDATGGAFTVTLPTPDAANDRMIVNIKKVDSSVNAITIDGDGNDIDGNPTESLPAQWDSLTLQCADGEWFILGRIS
jgi:hypothetical protein